MPKRKQRPWIICPECRGDGHHAQHMGEINTDEWEPEELERYFDGEYDRTCDHCGGAGKVRKGDAPVRKKPWWVDDPIARAERAMGA